MCRLAQVCRRQWGEGGAAVGADRLSDEQATALYSEPSVADYIAEQVTANILETATLHECWCYNLPATRPHTSANSAYHAERSQLLAQLSFPREYVRDVAGE
ncbi:MAG: hypothetical protein ACI8W3_003456 [Myxococcota bacterium]|jgi:hypothetical protein